MELDFEIQEPKLKSIALPLRVEWIKEKGSWLIYKAETRTPTKKIVISLLKSKLRIFSRLYIAEMRKACRGIPNTQPIY